MALGFGIVEWVDTAIWQKILLTVLISA